MVMDMDQLTPEEQERVRGAWAEFQRVPDPLYRRFGFAAAVDKNTGAIYHAPSITYWVEMPNVFVMRWARSDRRRLRVR